MGASGWPGLGADLERLRRRRLRVGEVAAEQAVPGPVQVRFPTEEGKWHRPGDVGHRVEVLVGFGEVGGGDRGEQSVHRRPEARDGIVEPAGDPQALLGVRESLAERIGNPDRVGPPGEDVRERVGVADATGHGQRFVGEAPPPAPVAVPRQLGGKGREQPRPCRAVARTHGADRRFEHTEPGGVDASGGACPAAGVRQSGLHEQVTLVDLAGQLGRGQQGLAVGRVTRMTLGLAEGRR